MAMEHTIALRHYLRSRLGDWFGDDFIESHIVEFLPESKTVEKWDKSLHNTRTWTFIFIFGVIGFVGGLLLELLRLCLNWSVCPKSEETCDGGDSAKSERRCYCWPKNRDYDGIREEEAKIPLKDGDQLEGCQLEEYGVEDNNDEDDSVQGQADEDDELFANEEAEAVRKSVAGNNYQDLYFVAWQHIYAFMCFALAGYAFLNDYMSESCGLDFELYVPWLIGTIIFHFCCLICAYMRMDKGTSLPTTVLVIPMTCCNPAESHLGVLRDAVTAGIFARHWFLMWDGKKQDEIRQDFIPYGALMLSAVMIICIFLPNIKIYRDIHPFRDFQEGFWPVISWTDQLSSRQCVDQAARKGEDADASCGSLIKRSLDRIKQSLDVMAIQKKVLGTLDKMTREHKQWVACLGDLPQAVAGTIFLWHFRDDSQSGFILMVTILAFFKSILIITFRPHILCCLACAGLPWSHLTSTDVTSAMECKLCTWVYKSRACRQMLKDVQTTPKVRMAAIDALYRVSKEHYKCQPAEPAEGKPAEAADVEAVDAEAPTDPKDREHDETEQEELTKHETEQKELTKILHALLWEYARPADRDSQQVAAQAMRKISKEDKTWQKVATQLTRLRSDDPDEKQRAAVHLARFHPQWAGAYISDLVKLLSARPPRAPTSIPSERIKRGTTSAEDKSCNWCCGQQVEKNTKHDCEEAAKQEEAEQESGKIAEDTAEGAESGGVEGCTTKEGYHEVAIEGEEEAASPNKAGRCCRCLSSKPEDGFKDGEEDDGSDGEVSDERAAWEKAYTQTRDVREAASRAFGCLGQSLNTVDGRREISAQTFADVSEALSSKAPEVVKLLTCNSREVRSAALSAIVHFRGDAAVTAAKKAMELLEAPETSKGKRKVGEIALVGLVPYMPPDKQKDFTRQLVALLSASHRVVQSAPPTPTGRGKALTPHSVDYSPSSSAYNVLSRMGSLVAQEALETLESSEGQAGDSEKLEELKDVLRVQQQAVKNMGGSAAVAQGLNLLLDRKSDAVEQAEELYEKLAKGSDVFEVLANKGLAKKVESSDDGAILPVFFSDLEPDDIMFMAQMWKYLRDQPSRPCCTPLVVFSADMKGKDSGKIFERKILMLALVLGKVHLKVLTPGNEYVPSALKAGDKPPEPHPRTRDFEVEREENIKYICKRMMSDDRQEVRLYVCAPGRGNLSDIVAGLGLPKADDDDSLPVSKFSVSIYSGQFNIKHMTDKDLSAVCVLVGRKPKKSAPPADGKGAPADGKGAPADGKGAPADGKGAPEDGKGVLIDAAKFPFFGGLEAHTLTKSFTTFALPSFGPLLSTRYPLVAAVWAAINDEFNQKLIRPAKVFETHAMGAQGMTEIEQLYKDNKVTEYAQAIAKNDEFLKCVVKKKKVTLMAFACGCCDAPLCDQLIFICEWMKDRDAKEAARIRPEFGDFKQTWMRSEEGTWNYNRSLQYTSVDTNSSIPGLRAKQPVMRNPHDAEALYLISEALQHYTLGHMSDLA